MSTSLSRRGRTVLWLNVIGSTSLIGTEVFAISASFDWAISGLLGLSPAITIALAVLLFAVSGAITWLFARHALTSERDLALRGDL